MTILTPFFTHIVLIVYQNPITGFTVLDAGCASGFRFDRFAGTGPGFRFETVEPVSKYPVCYLSWGSQWTRGVLE